MGTFLFSQSAKRSKNRNVPIFERDPSLETQLTKSLGETLRGEVRAFEHVNSTMDVAHALAQDGAAEGTLVWAQRQEQGRGRLGRVWESPEGGIYCSLIVRPQRPATEIPQLSLLMGLSAAEAIRESAMVSPRVRWPNDLLLNGKKIAGILSERAGGGCARPWLLGLGQDKRAFDCAVLSQRMCDIHR